MLAWFLIPLGVVIMIYSKQVGDFIGSVEWAERFFGGGGTYTAVKLGGLLLTVLSFMWVTGGLQGVLVSVTGSFF